MSLLKYNKLSCSEDCSIDSFFLIQLLHSCSTTPFLLCCSPWKICCKSIILKKGCANTNFISGSDLRHLKFLKILNKWPIFVHSFKQLVKILKPVYPDYCSHLPMELYDEPWWVFVKCGYQNTVQHVELVWWTLKVI